MLNLQTELKQVSKGNSESNNKPDSTSYNFRLCSGNQHLQSIKMIDVSATIIQSYPHNQINISLLT